MVFKRCWIDFGDAKGICQSHVCHGPGYNTEGLNESNKLSFNSFDQRLAMLRSDAITCLQHSQRSILLVEPNDWTGFAWLC